MYVLFVVKITACLDLLVRTAERTGLMHESFNVNNVNDYTRYVCMHLGIFAM